MTRITTQKFMDEMGMATYDDLIDYIGRVVCDDEEAIAMCEYLCTVEPDGCCEHGNPSVLLTLGIV